MAWSNSADKALRERAAAVIPNGMYGHQSVAPLPDGYPQFYAKAKGAYLWDADGNEYIDYMCGYGPNLLGYGHPEVDAAFTAQLAKGDAMTGPGVVMVDAAEAMVRQISHAHWVMFCKNGTDATTMALMIARHHTGRKTIIRAKGAYHGAVPWCSPSPNGITPADRADQIFCDYNDPASLEAAVRLAGSDLAAIFAAPIKHDVFVDQEPLDPEYARRARALADETGAVLVVDDVRAGLRLARDCSWSLVGVQPDLSCWGKAIANGHPLSALAGSEPFRRAAGTIFATGSYWFAAAPMAAAVATLKLIRETDYLERTIRIGDRLRKGLDEAAEQHGFRLRQTGPSQMPLIFFDDDPGFGKTYFWISALVRRGVLMHPWHNMFTCAAMTEADVDATLERASDAFALTRAAGRIEPIEALLARTR